MLLMEGELSIRVSLSSISVSIILLTRAPPNSEAESPQVFEILPGHNFSPVGLNIR